MSLRAFTLSAMMIRFDGLLAIRVLLPGVDTIFFSNIFTFLFLQTTNGRHVIQDKNLKHYTINP